MKKTIYSLILGIFLIAIIILALNSHKAQFKSDKIVTISGVIVNKEDTKTIIKDTQNKRYAFENIKEDIGTKVDLTFLSNTEEVLNYKVLEASSIPSSWLDKGIFKEFYYDAYQKLQEMSLSEKISQVLLVHYQNKNNVELQEKYQFGGFIFFEKDFKDKTKEEVLNMITELQTASKIPVLTAVDEEGGTVTRISHNKNLVESPFKSPQELYQEGGLEKIQEDVKYKSQILKELGLNLNLAPVVDVSTDKNDYIYKRTLGLPTEEVSKYAEAVIETSKNTGVSYTLKHFSGYGNNTDTHKGTSEDYKSYEDIVKYDLPPFDAGIKKGAEAIMNSHNIVMSIDSENPASLSKKVHDILRQDLEFTGIIITDDLNMGALKNIPNKEVKALLAGNDLLITSNYEESYNNILNGINNNLISEEELNHSVFRLLAWKYYKNLI